MKTPFLVLVGVPFALAALTSVHVARAAAPTVPECLTASEASIKLRSEHKLRLARVQLLTCVSASCPGEVAQECSRRMDQLTAAIPTIVFEVKDAAGNEGSAVKVTMDGEVVADHLDGSALTLDPGSHSFTFEAAGQPAVTKTFMVHESEKGRRETIVVGMHAAVPATAVAPAPVPAAPSESVAPVAPAMNPAETTRDDSGHGRKVLGVVVGSVGVAGLAVGGIFLGGLQLSEVSTTKSACPKLVNCSSQAVNDRSTALTYGNVSTGALIAGGVLLAGGLALYFTAPKSMAQTVGVQVGPGMLSVKGTF